MEKNIKDYLPYYTEQFLHVESYGTYKLVAYDQMQELYGIKHGTKTIWHPITNEFKLILRKLESINREESEMMERFRSELKRNDLTASFRLTHYLLSKGFDLFGLIESGLATEKQPTTQNQGV